MKYNILVASVVCCILVQHVSAQYNYAEVLRQSILFYEAERSGDLPSNNRIPYRGDSAMNDRGQAGEDLIGGWYDAGDHVKFNFPMAWSVTTLAWGILEFQNAYQTAGEYQNALDSIRWPLDYLLKCHIANNEFYGQVGDGHVDHAWWGRPEDMTMNRPAWKITASQPGSDLAAETAAAMAASSLVFRPSDAAYADRLLDNARRLYDFAYTFRGIYSNSISNAAAFYSSSGYNDELSWGAAWLYRATGEQIYLTRALEFAEQGIAWAYSWDSKLVGYQLLLSTNANQGQFRAAVEGFINSYRPGGGITYTPKGLAWRDQWGPNRYAANAAFIALVAAKHGILTTEGQTFARSQIHYMLGDSGRSYVCGFGNNPPVRPHHRSSSCQNAPTPCDWNDYNSPNPNPQVLWGALVGGPDQNDNYEDSRSDYIKNEVANDYNAGFQGAVAGLLSV